MTLAELAHNIIIEIRDMPVTIYVDIISLLIKNLDFKGKRCDDQLKYLSRLSLIKIGNSTVECWISSPSACQRSLSQMSSCLLSPQKTKRSMPLSIMYVIYCLIKEIEWVLEVYHQQDHSRWSTDSMSGDVQGIHFPTTAILRTWICPRKTTRLFCCFICPFIPHSRRRSSSSSSTRSFCSQSLVTCLSDCLSL